MVDQIVKRVVHAYYLKVEFKAEALALAERLGVPAAKELVLHESQLYGGCKPAPSRIRAKWSEIRQPRLRD